MGAGLTYDYATEKERKSVVSYLLAQADNYRLLARQSRNLTDVQLYMSEENLIHHLAFEIGQGRHVADHPAQPEQDTRL